MDLSPAISLSTTLSLLSPISPSSSSLPPFSLSRRCHHLRRCNLSRSFCLPPAVLSTSREDEEEIGGSEFDEEDDYAEDEDTLDVDSLEREAQLVVREFSDSLSQQLIIGLFISISSYIHFTF